MYAIVCSYVVPEEKTGQFLELARRASAAYARHGCVGTDLLRAAGGEWLEINRFPSREEFMKVRPALDSDPEILALWKEFTALLGTEQVNVKEYETVEM